MKFIYQCLNGLMSPIDCAYYLFSNAKLLVYTNIIIILLILLIDLPRISKIGFLGTSLVMLFYLWTNTVLLAYNMINIGIKHHMKLSRVMLILCSLIITYSLVYYAIYNNDQTSFSGHLDKTDEMEDHVSGYKGSLGRYLDMFYFTITTMFTGNYGDIIPRNRFSRFIVITQFIIAAVLLSILLAKSN
jgi:hypothetical protein